MSKNDKKNVDNTYSGSILDELLNDLSGIKSNEQMTEPEKKTAKSIKAHEKKPKAGSSQNEDIHSGHRERLRQKFAENMSFDGLSDHEILELLLFYVIPRTDTNELAHKLIKKFGSFPNVLNAPFSELIACKGLNEQSAMYIKILMRLCAKYNIEMQKQILVSNAESLEDYLLYQFSGESEECAKLFLVDQKGKLSAPHDIGRGLEDKSVFDFKEAVNIIVNSASTYVMLAHNHLNIDQKKPSENDVIITRRFRQMLEPIGITLIDHFVICDNEVMSMRALGLIDI